MLDQNTDRMWYVIGAVIVGAALIFLMNGTFPGIFGSIGATFEEKVIAVRGDVSEIKPTPSNEWTDGVGPGVPNENMIAYADIALTAVHPRKVSIVAFDEAEGMWTVELQPDMVWNEGLRTVAKDNVVPYGASYTVSYEVWTPVDLHADNDINAHPLVDGVQWTRVLNDSDNEDKRQFSPTLAKGGQWTKMWFTYTNDHPDNVDQLSVFDRSNFGLVNDTNEAVQIKIRRVKGELSDHPTPYVPAIVNQVP